MDKSFFSQKVLATSFLLAMTMVAVEVGSWVSLFSFVVLLWKFGSEKWRWKPLGRRTTGVLSVLLLLQVLFEYRTLVGQEPAYTFLLGLSALRVMDYRNERDHRFLVMLGFVLISVKALFNLDIYWILPSLLSFFGFWFSLLPQTLPGRGLFLVRIFLLSIPLMAALFFAFPRVVMPWAMSRGSNYGEIGFSDQMNPGKVAELAGSTAMVFRARINETPLKTSEELYWRGSVLGNSRGLSWRPQRTNLKAVTEAVPNGSYYEVALEPTSQNYLFTLDGTENVELEVGSVIPLQSGLFRATRPLFNTTVYRGLFNPRYVDREVPTESDLQIPRLTGKVAEWVELIKRDYPSPEERIEQLKALFSETGFFYTLNPGVYSANDLEEFLFVRKRGFCEHFAGAYGTLARALEIPARVIVGYQGGLYNPWGDFWKVAHKDAHAWVEIYQNEQWVQVDPTRWVAPLRLVIGATSFFALSEEDQRAFAREISWKPPTSSDLMLWDQVTFWMDDLNYRWTYFLIDFDRSAQKSLLQDILNDKIRYLILGFAFLILLGVLVRFFSLGRRSESESQRLLLMVEVWGEKHQIPRNVGEPPLTYLRRLEAQFPILSRVLASIGRTYDQQSYQQVQPSVDTKKLQKLWKTESSKI